jgi:peptidyl-prolyl cis-trans isomerase SurA
MKGISIFFLFSSSILFSQETGIVVDKIVAQIGNQIILMSDVESQKQQAIQSGLDPLKINACEILEQLMANELLLDQALLDSISVSDEQVDAEMENRLRLLEEKFGSREKLETFYGETTSKIKDKFRIQIRNKILTQEMERKLVQNISITPKDVSTFFKSIPKDSIPFINMKLSFQQIVYYPKITKDDKKRAYDILSEVRTAIVDNGKSFETQARINSDDPGSASKGGKIEASAGMMVPQFESTVFQLKVGEISEIIESPYGYHIIKLISRKGQDYTCLHILKIPEYSPEAIDNASNRMDTCYQLLKENKITWNDAVLRFSNDESTKQNQGIITNPITGDQTWDMEDLNQVDQQIYVLTEMMEKGDYTKPNLYIDIYERKQGFRIVRLMERYIPHIANLKDDYSLIKRATENDKKQKTIKLWVNSKIQNTYIRIDKDYQDCQLIKEFNINNK